MMGSVEMSRRYRPRAQRKHALLLATLGAGTAAVAADAPPLPADFLEYLGSWDAGDADWLVANASAPRASAAVPIQPDSTMTDKRGAAQSPATTEHKP